MNQLNREPLPHDPEVVEKLQRKYGESAMELLDATLAENDRLREANKELVACCERALTESARVHPDFMAQLQAALAKARGKGGAML